MCFAYITIYQICLWYVMYWLDNSGPFYSGFLYLNKIALSSTVTRVLTCCTFFILRDLIKYTNNRLSNFPRWNVKAVEHDMVLATIRHASRELKNVHHMKGHDALLTSSTWAAAGPLHMNAKVQLFCHRTIFAKFP